MYCKICLKCGKEFETDVMIKKFCCRSCANSYTTSARKIPDQSIFANGINKINSYILGLIYSDGCLSFDNHCHRFRITISLNDIDIMKKVHQLMTPDKRLYEYKHPRGRRTTYSVISCNEADIEFIKGKGISERKSAVITFPQIDSRYIPHFVRGYFDGDGSIYINKTTTNYNNVRKHYQYTNASFTTGSIGFAHALNSVLLSNEINSHVVKDSREDHNCWYVKIYEEQSMKKFYKWMYEDADLYLERKKQKFTEMI